MTEKIEKILAYCPNCCHFGTNNIDCKSSFNYEDKTCIHYIPIRKVSKLANMLNPFDFTWIKEIVDFIPEMRKNLWQIGKYEPEKIDIDKVLNEKDEKLIMRQKDVRCTECNNILYTTPFDIICANCKADKKDIDKVLSVHTEQEKILPKDCDKCIHKSVCKMLDYIHKDNFKLGLLLSRFFEIYTDSNIADKCVKYKEEVKGDG